MDLPMSSCSSTTKCAAWPLCGCWWGFRGHPQLIMKGINVKKKPIKKPKRPKGY